MTNERGKDLRSYSRPAQRITENVEKSCSWRRGRPGRAAPTRHDALPSRQLQDAIVVAVGYVERARRMNIYAVGPVQLGLERILGHQTRPLLSRAGNRHRFPAARSEFSDEVVFRVRDNDVVLEIHAEVLRPVQLWMHGRLVRLCGTNQGSDLALFVDNAQRITAAFEDVEVSFRVDSDRPGIDKRAAGRIRAVCGDAGLAVPGNCPDLARLQAHHTNALVAEVGDIDPVPGFADVDPKDTVKLSPDRRTPVAGITRFSGAGDCRYSAGLQIDFSDAVVASVGYIQLPAVSDDQSVRLVERCLRGRGSVAAVAWFFGAREQADDAAPGHSGNSVPLIFADVPVFISVKGHSKGLDEPGLQGGASERALAATGDA